MKMIVRLNWVKIGGAEQVILYETSLGSQFLIVAGLRYNIAHDSTYIRNYQKLEHFCGFKIHWQGRIIV